MRIPAENDFIVGWKQDGQDPDAKPKPIFTDYIDAPEVRAIGDRLIQSGPLGSLDDGKLVVDYRWKRKGGTSQGAARYAMCQKLSGAAKHYASGAQFMVWLAADHNADRDERQIEALIFHELQHIDCIETEDEDLEGNPIIAYKIRAHDVELFFADLEQYGAWSDHLQHLERVVKQLPLPIVG